VQRRVEDLVPTSEARVAELVARFGAADVCLARLLCDDHPADRVAFTIVEPDLTRCDLTFGVLRDRSERLAASLAKLGVGPGDAVGVLMGKSAELVVVLLAIWRRGAVGVPLFTAFAPPAIAMRLHGSDANLVIVDSDQRTKLDPSEDVPADAPWRVVTVGDAGHEGDLAFDELIDRPADPVEPVVTGPDAPFLMIFTSGTTGTPKGVPVPVRALAHMLMYLEYGYDLRAQDVYKVIPHNPDGERARRIARPRGRLLDTGLSLWNSTDVGRHPNAHRLIAT
jgi:acetyl-CoA synthetase